MIRLKPGVRIVHRELGLALLLRTAETVYAEAGFPMVITSVADGTHSRGSGHYRGDAFDTRVRDPGGQWSIPPELRREMVRKANVALGDRDFVVKLSEDHLHWQHRPLEPFA